MIEDQAQYGVGFHLHGFFDKGQPFAGRVLPVFRFRGLKNALDLAEKRLEQAAKQRVLRLIADLDRPDGRAGTFGDLPQRRAPIALFQKLGARGFGDFPVQRGISTGHGFASSGVNTPSLNTV